MTFRVWPWLLVAPLAMAAPPNDDFANRLTISGDLPLTFASDGTGATREDADRTSFSHTLWFEWQAPTSGLHAIHVPERKLNWHIRVIGPEGDIADNRYWSHRPESGMTYFHAQAGEIYQLMVALPDEAPFTLALRHGLSSQPNPVPLGNATPVTAQRGQSSSDETMTWQWTAPTGELTSVATIPVGYPFADESHFISERIVHVEEGEPLYLGLLNVLEGTGPYRPGHWQIEVRPEPALPNDHFENAAPLVADAPEWTRAQAFFAIILPTDRDLVFLRLRVSPGL